MLIAVTSQRMPEQQKLLRLTAANPALFRLSPTLDYADVIGICFADTSKFSLVMGCRSRFNITWSNATPA
jgi:hypothetical protein